MLVHHYDTSFGITKQIRQKSRKRMLVRLQSISDITSADRFGTFWHYSWNFRYIRDWWYYWTILTPLILLIESTWDITPFFLPTAAQKTSPPLHFLGYNARRYIPEMDNCPIIIVISGLQRRNFQKVSGGVVSQVDCICLFGASSSLSLHTCTFFRCKADVNPCGGGGFFASEIEKCSTYSSSFILCSTNSAGGATFFQRPNNDFVSDTLYSGNTATSRGGAIREIDCSASLSLHIKFSFFTSNSAPAEWGNDFAVAPDLSTTPFLYSFSTTATNRVAYYASSTSTKDHSDWLPLGEIRYPKYLILKCFPLPLYRYLYPNIILHISLNRYILWHPLLRTHRQNKTFFHFF